MVFVAIGGAPYQYFSTRPVIAVSGARRLATLTTCDAPTETEKADLKVSAHEI
jgi:hypothetical protein